MTIIAYTGVDRTLYADSGVVVDYGSVNQRIDLTDSKIYVDPDKHFALAATGYCIRQSQLQAFLKYIIPKIRMYLLEGDESALGIDAKEHRLHGLVGIRYIIVTTEGVFVFYGDKLGSSIHHADPNDDVIFGNTVVHMHAAMRSHGRTPREAMELGIKYCDYSRGPVRSYSTADLIPFPAPSKEESK